MHAIKDALYDITVVLVGLIRISEPVKAYRPLTLSVCHLKPFIISFIEFSLNLYSISLAVYGLIIWPLSSKFNVFFHFIKFYLPLYVEILRRKLELSKIRVNGNIFVYVILQKLRNNIALVCTKN